MGKMALILTRGPGEDQRERTLCPGDDISDPNLNREWIRTDQSKRLGPFFDAPLDRAPIYANMFKRALFDQPR
jgi:hypothetical protein